jgi:hypothetical protein
MTKHRPASWVIFSLLRRQHLNARHVKQLQYTVRVAEPNPGLANLLLEQFGGPQGELRNIGLPPGLFFRFYAVSI